MEQSPQKKERVVRILSLAAASFVGYELARTMRHAKKTGYTYFDKHNRTFLIGLLRDDTERIAQIAGKLLASGEIEVDSDSIEEAELAEVNEMLERRQNEESDD